MTVNKRNTIVVPAKLKRTLTPNTPDTPDNSPLTPDMNVLTPDTPDTPDTKTNVPKKEGSGFFVSGDDEILDFSGSGYSEIESGVHKPLISLNSPYLQPNTTENGTFQVFWKPINSRNATINVKGSDFSTETNVSNEAKTKANDRLISEGFRKNSDDTYLKRLGTSASLTNISKEAGLLMDHSVLHDFLGLFGRSHIAKTGTAKKHRTSHSSKSHLSKLHHGNSYKKQGLEVPFDDKESLGGDAPMGSVDAEGGLDGLGSDMHGFPAGMGAGAEPLGAYDQKEGPVGLPQDENEPPSSATQGGPSFGGPMGFSRQPSPNGMMMGGGDAQETNFGPRPPMDGDDSQRLLPMSGMPGMSGMQGIPGMSGMQGMPGMFGQTNEAAESVLGPPQVMQGFLNPPAVMGESMSNNLGAMDKANIQGDSGVAQMVRQREMQDQAQEPTANEDAQFIGTNDPGDEELPSEFKNFQSNEFNSEEVNYRPNIVANKRLLSKNKKMTKKGWKSFKTLQHQGFKNLQGKHHG